MQEGEHLLRLRTEDSLNQMLTNANELKYPFYGLRADNVRVVEGLKTLVRLSGHEPVLKNDIYPYRGSIDFEFNRLDINEFFKGMLDDFRPALPISTQDLTDEITRRTGHRFEITDVIHEEIGRTDSVAYRLKAKAESLRWAGEITLRLSDLEFLVDILDGLTGLATDSDTSRLEDFNQMAPFVNVTRFLSGQGRVHLDAALVDQELQYMSAESRQLILNMFAFQHGGSAAVIQETPAPFNLYNARIMAKDLVAPTLYPNRMNPYVDRILHLQLDLAYCTNTIERNVYLRYTRLDNITYLLNPMARVMNTGGLSPFNGTSVRSFLRTLSVGQFITAAPDMELEPGEMWSAGATPSPRTLYRSVVQYNGPRRGQDSTSIHEDMTHVLVVTVNESFNTVWRGNLHIYYRED